MDLSDKTILVTGGTGSFGKKFTEIVLKKYNPKKLIIFSRDEYKQSEMAKIFHEDKYPAIRYFLGDVRDKYRLVRAFEEVDYVIHTAALKQVPALEYNPMEAVKTNVLGADNIIHAAIEARVKKVIGLSTDKAVNPINLYGATKLVAEKVFIAANAYAGGKVKFSIVRYGNVVGSRGSVVPLFLNLKKRGIKEYPITDVKMTRFWITLEQSVEFVLKALEESEGGEIFVPKIPSMKVIDLAKALEPDCKIKLIGIRHGEKINEIMISEEEARNTKYFNGAYVILPHFLESKDLLEKYKKYPFIPEGFFYCSDKNDLWLTLDELKDMAKNIE
ncbi:MAG: UDP-N-acetylglucosamine 4,6-dehydratase (inverting) [Actinobacteria bacterium RBG_19FT_COMBO_36_27]|nr:MAG: UDP-N-acetylglucosamine 4,6-dehydratase (inverting) [Actinobacteria bacterium RBG_19FT_COMBO_36_27]